MGGHKSGGRETGKRLEEYSRQEMMAGQNRMLIVEVKRNGYNFKVEEWFPDRLNVSCERKKEVKDDFKVFGLSNLKDGHVNKLRWGRMKE